MLFLILDSLSAQTILGKTVELKKKTYTTQEVMKELQGEHRISISFGHLPDRKVRFESNAQTVREVLNQALKNTSYKYQEVRGKILIIKKSNKSNQSTKATISGFVKEAETGEALIGATIYNTKSGSGVISNNYGFFSLTLPKGQVELTISYLGFESEEITKELTDALFLNINMTASSYSLEEVTVLASEIESLEISPEMSTISLTAKQIENVPTILGEYDVLKAIQLLPGIQGGTEGSSGIYVRGGGPDQNLILMDGVPVYNTAHVFGFFSIFNGDAVKKVDVVKGGFPARYGGRLSSVIDISMKEGNNQKLSGKGSVGIISSKFTLEGPIKNDNTSFLLSGRRTYLDLVANPFDIKNDNDFYFYDFSAKINHRFSDRDRVYLSFYGGKDAFIRNSEIRLSSGNLSSKETETSLDWGNIISVLRWNHVFNPKLFGAFSGSYSRFQFNTADERFVVQTGNSEAFEYSSGIKDFALKATLEYQSKPHYSINGGLSAIKHQFNTGVINLDNANREISNDERSSIPAIEYSAYLENDLSLGKMVRINFGAHASLFDVDSKQYYSLQPRISSRFLFENQFSIKASYSEMRQFIHLLTNSGIGLPTDLWVPSTESVNPQFSRQIALGAVKVYSNLEVSLEGYYKEMDNLIEYQNGASYLSTDTNWENKIEAGEGTSYGVELLVRKNFGKLTGWVGYTWSKTTRRFENLNFGKSFDYKYDRRHDVGVTGTYQLHKNWTISGNWVYGTGTALTLPTTRYLSANVRVLGSSGDPIDDLVRYYFYNVIENFDQRNNYRMRDYHRLDLSISWSKKKKQSERTWSMGVYNAYNRLNTFFIYVDTEEFPDPKLKQYALLPAIPFISYSFKF